MDFANTLSYLFLAHHLPLQEHHYVLQAIIRSEELDPQRHYMRVDVKTATLHRFRLEQTDTGGEAFVIVDV